MKKDMNQLNITDTSGYTIRPHQKPAIQRVVHGAKLLVQEKLEFTGNAKFPNAHLLEMATGSGKTVTVWKILEKLIQARNRLNHKNENLFNGLKIVLLSNRIDGVQQFRDDLIYGRIGESGKPPILSQEIINNLSVYTYHSRQDWDNLSDRDEYVEITNENHEDELVCSTYQTAQLKWLVKKIPYVDVIIIDEAHNVRGENDFCELLDALNMTGRNGNSPLIIPVTATPSNLTTKLFGDPVYTFWLWEYLASGFAPAVEYNLVTGTNATVKEVEEMRAEVELLKWEIDPIRKSIWLAHLTDRFNNLIIPAEDLFSKENIVWFATDIVKKISYIEDSLTKVDPTVIFTNSIKSANDLVEQLQKYFIEDNYVLAYHSGTKNHWLQMLRDWYCKILVVVDKLNESVDLPIVQNIILARNTPNPKIFFQQFGRGLRWNGTVRYFDYVGSFMNFVWIGQIHEQYRKAQNGKNDNIQSVEKDNIQSVEKDKNFSIRWLDFWNHILELAEMGLFLASVNKKTITKDDIFHFFHTFDAPVEMDASRMRSIAYGKLWDIAYSEIDFHGHKVSKLAQMIGYPFLPKDGFTQDYQFKRFLNFIFQDTPELLRSNDDIQIYNTYTVALLGKLPADFSSNIEIQKAYKKMQTQSPSAVLRLYSFEPSVLSIAKILQFFNIFTSKKSYHECVCDFFQLIFPHFQTVEGENEGAFKKHLQDYYIEQYNKSIVTILQAALQENLVPHHQHDIEFIKSLY